MESLISITFGRVVLIGRSEQPADASHLHSAAQHATTAVTLGSLAEHGFGGFCAASGAASTAAGAASTVAVTSMESSIVQEERARRRAAPFILPRHPPLAVPPRPPRGVRRAQPSRQACARCLVLSTHRGQE